MTQNRWPRVREETVTLELVAMTESGDKGEIGPSKLGSIAFRPATRAHNRNATIDVPRRWILAIPDGYSVNWGEVIDVTLPTWKARELGFVR